jgi:hypothetical protein
VANHIIVKYSGEVDDYPCSKELFIACGPTADTKESFLYLRCQPRREPGCFAKHYLSDCELDSRWHDKRFVCSGCNLLLSLGSENDILTLEDEGWNEIVDEKPPLKRLPS